jgi:hypothetical protein
MSDSFAARSSGSIVAGILRQSWRKSYESDLRVGQIHRAVSLLCATGSAGLIASRLTHLPPDLEEQLQTVFRQQAIAAMLQEHSVKDVFARMRGRGIEPILFKGWGLARLYPDAAMRPSGDIDLWVPASQLEETYRAIPTDGSQRYCVELHTSFYSSYERSFTDVMDRSQCASLEGTDVRMPCPEDHLRFICLHFLYHGGWRPLWLCDVALMVETRKEDFDWDRCLQGKRKVADWVACVIGLAHQLLGAEISGTPVETRATNLPAWLVTAVLKQWGGGVGMSHAETLSFSLPRRLTKPSALVDALREHWRNPIQAAVEMNASFGKTPRKILQLGAALSRVPKFANAVIPEIKRTRTREAP